MDGAQIKPIIVLDASILATILLNEPNKQRALPLYTLFNDGKIDIHVPDIFIDEILNALLKAEYRNTKQPSALSEFLFNIDNILAQLTLHDIIYSADNILQRAALARKHNLRSYDVIYLQLAITLNASLATFDDRLIRAAKNEQCYFEL